MLNINAVLLGIAFSLTQVNGHFLLNYPPTLGFNDDKEGTGPCGGFEPSLTNTTDFHIGGDAISVKSTHPAANWYFRATTDATAQGNWTNFLPEVAQTGLGEFCEKALTLPESFAGKQGFVQAVQQAVDGNLYQCAAVNFVTGVAPSVPSVCKNATGVTASFAASPTDGGAAPSKTSEAAAATSSSAGTAMGGSDVFGALGAAVMLSAGLFVLVL